MRTLSDGSLVINPNRLINKKAVEAAIRNANTTPEAKQAALGRLPEVRARAIDYFYNELSKHEGFEEQLSGYGGSKDEALQHFLNDASQSPHWTQIRNRVLGGFMGLLTSGAGAVAGVTGDEDAHTAMEIFSGKQGAYELKASMVDTNGLTRAVSKVAGASPSLIPALGVGRVVGVVGRLAGLSQQATQSLALMASSFTAGGQTFGSVYNEAREAYVDSGMAEEEARRAALKPAIIGGLITAAVTRAGGANGVEAVFRNAGARELVKRTLIERAKTVGIDFTEEAVEEGFDQLLQGIVARFNHRQGLTNEQIIEEAVEAAWIGGLLGGTVSGVQEGSQALWDKDGKLNEAVMRPPEDAPVGDVMMPSSEGGAGGTNETPSGEMEGEGGGPNSNDSNSGPVEGNKDPNSHLPTQPPPKEPPPETVDEMDKVADERRADLANAREKVEALKGDLDRKLPNPNLTVGSIREAADAGDRVARARKDELERLKPDFDSLPESEKAGAGRAYNKQVRDLMEKWSEQDAQAMRAAELLERMKSLHGSLPTALRHDVSPPEAKDSSTTANVRSWLHKVDTAAKGSLEMNHFDIVAEVDADMRSRATEEERRTWLEEAGRVAVMSPSEVDAELNQVRRALQGDASANPRNFSKEELMQRQRLLDVYGGTHHGGVFKIPIKNGMAVFGPVRLDSEAGIRSLSERSRTHMQARRGAAQVRQDAEHKLSGKRWDVGSGRVVSGASYAQVATHRDYAAARAGDLTAAQRVVQDTAPVQLLRETSARHPNARVVVMPGAKAGAPPSALGTAYANQLLGGTPGKAPEQGFSLVEGKLDSLSSDIRSMAFRPKFQGKVEKGAEYILVVEEGGDGVALAELRHHIQRHGGNVVEMHAVGGTSTDSIGIIPKTKHEIKARFNSHHGVNVTLRANNFYGGVIDALTEAEAQTMLKYGSDKELEEALNAEAKKELLSNNDPNWNDEQNIRRARGLVWWSPLAEADQTNIETYRKVIKSSTPLERNVLICRGKINGEKIELKSHSGEDAAQERAGRPANYETVHVGHDRQFDSEPNVLEPLTDKLNQYEADSGQAAEGEIEIVSSFRICESCQGVIRMFREKFPNVTLKLKAGK